MPFNIAAFKTNGLVYGGARPSLFNIFLSVPLGIGIDNVSVDKFRFVARAAQLPESTVSPIEVPYFGRKIKVAGERAFQNWSVTVMNDEDFAVRSMFELWSNSLNRLVSNVRSPVLAVEQYKADLEIVQYSVDGSTLRSYQLIGAFPINVSGIGLDWNNANQYEEFSVEFAYDYWIPGIETSDKKAGGLNPYSPEAFADGPNGPS
jgi:hypothetical protein